MQTKILCRLIAFFPLAVTLLGCSPAADNPYSKIPDPPVVSASLHTVTVVSPDAALADVLQKDGFAPAAFPSNYPASVKVEALLWKVPEEAVAGASVFMAPAGKGPNVRLLVTSAPAPATPVDAEVEKAFYRNVLGSDVPRWPGSTALPPGARVHAWTYFISDVVAAKRRLRAAGIPVSFDPVDITTAFLGDHRTMGIVAPDGAVIELVQNSAQ